MEKDCTDSQKTNGDNNFNISGDSWFELSLSIQERDSSPYKGHISAMLEHFMTINSHDPLKAM